MKKTKENGVTLTEETMAEFDENTRTVTWKMDKVNSSETKLLRVHLGIKPLDNEITQKDIEVFAKVQADGTKVYEAKPDIITVGRPMLKISQTTNTYVKEGDTINYRFNITNEGSVTAQSVVLRDEIPEGLVARSISYVANGVPVKKSVSEKDEVRIGTSIQPNETLEVDIEAMAVSLNGAQELSVTNSGTVVGKNISESKSNEITHIIEASNVSSTAPGESSSGKPSSSVGGTTSSLSKTYKIEGVAWLDKNKDGMRTNDEELMKGIKATLVDTNTGMIKQTVSTNSKGEYTFSSKWKLYYNF